MNLSERQPTELHQNFSTTLAVFPGQGSQHVGMGKDLFENFVIAKRTFEEASDAIHVDLKKLCFEGPESDLTLTENTQPSLLVASVAAFRVAQTELGFRPSVAAGHSLGEYSALVANGTLELASAARWVKARGRAMQDAVPPGTGTMAAILGIEDQMVELLCRKATEESIKNQPKSSDDTHTDQGSPIVEPANFNAPGQVVIAGSSNAVAIAIALIKSDPEFAKGKAIPLNVSAPFHCRLMQPARERMTQLFSECHPSEKPKTMDFGYIPNRTARITQEPGAVFELLIEQIDHPVLWKQSIQNLLTGQTNRMVEFGPGKVLSGLFKRISSGTDASWKVTSVSDTASFKQLENFFASG